MGRRLPGQCLTFAWNPKPRFHTPHPILFPKAQSSFQANLTIHPFKSLCVFPTKVQPGKQEKVLTTLQTDTCQADKCHGLRIKNTALGVWFKTVAWAHDRSSFPLEITFTHCCCQREVTTSNVRGRGYSPGRAALPSRPRLWTPSSQERQWTGVEVLQLFCT